jgi:hypothetical protein
MLFGLCPPGALGKYSGFYGFTGKVSSFTTIIYAAITHGQEDPFRHRLGIIALAAPVAVGFLYILAVRAGRAVEPDPSTRG